eukprot:Lankesteria_metandrocarpae@DN2273_c0_g1_i2.p1
MDIGGQHFNNMMRQSPPGMPPQYSAGHHQLHGGQGPHTITQVAPLVQMEEEAYATERKGTNLGWVVLFLAAAVAAFCVGLHGFIVGQSGKLGRGANSRGLSCGFDPEVRKLPYLYFPLDPADSQNSNSLFSKSLSLLPAGRCVEKCPNEKDVEEGMVVPVTKRIWKDLPNKGASMVVALEVATPAHATSAVASGYCLPLDPRLRSQALLLLSASVDFLPMIGASISSSWALILGCTISAAFLGVMGALLFRQFPKFTVMGAPYATAAALTLGGLMSIGTALRGGPGSPFLYQMVPSNSRLALFAGFVMLFFGVVIPTVTLNSPRHRVRAQRALDYTGDVFVDMSNIVVAPLLCSLGALFVLSIWMAGFANLSSLTTKRAFVDYATRPEDALQSVNDLRLSLGATIFLIFWTLFAWWVLELLKTLTQFASCYAATIWYFAPPEGGEEKEMGWCPALVAFSLGITNHLGTFVLGSLVMWVTSTVRALGTWTSSKNDESADTYILVMQSVFGRFKEPIRKIVDHLTPAGFVETAITSTEFWTSMNVSSRRLGVAGSPSSRLFSSIDSTMRYFSIAVALIVTFCGYTSLVSPTSNHSRDGSPAFVMCPVAITLVRLTLLLCWCPVHQCFVNDGCNPADYPVFSEY